MPDMLAKLFDLPPLAPALAVVDAQGVAIRRALVPERPLVTAWVHTHYPAWTAEVDVAFARLPVTCFIALRKAQVVGCCVYDVVCRNFFGPMAIAPDARQRGIGRALALAVLHAQRDAGYAYAIIGGAGPEEFYAKVAGAITIAGSSPGIYAGMLRG